MGVHYSFFKRRKAGKASRAIIIKRLSNARN